MKAYLPFGDPSNDGHGQCKMVLVEVPHLTAVSEAEQRIKEKYGQWFFSGFAEDCNEPFLSEDIWKALIETDYPIERFRVKEDSNDWEDVNSLAEAIAIDPNPSITLDFCIDAYIWLVNAFGAEVMVCDEDVPTISCSSPGYGCFLC